jgi:hypothetical protein
MRYENRLTSVSAATALALLSAGPLRAQEADVAITDIVISDLPQSFVQDQVLTQALNDAQNDALLHGNDLLKDSLQGAVIAAFGTTAETIIGSFQLDALPGLQFTTIGNKAAFEQDGLRNLAQVEQSGGNAGWAVINQVGEDNATFIDQADTGAISQRSLNRIYVGQVGNSASSNSLLYSNYAYVQQTHRTGFSGTNRVNNATIQQGGFRDVAFNRVAVQYNAVAARNDALIEQDGAENDGVIQQGAETAATFAFETGDTIGRNNRAILRQIGYGNRGVILQEDDANAITHQYGADNLAFVRQDGDVLDGGQYSRIEQGRPESGDVNSNIAAVFQRGMLQESTVLQHSNSNDAYVYQTAEAAYARSSIEQTGGGGNFASVMQSASSLIVADGVLSTILQRGSDNEAYVSQTTVSSKSVISQTGNGNFARLRQ